MSVLAFVADFMTVAVAVAIAALAFVAVGVFVVMAVAVFVVVLVAVAELVRFGVQALARPHVAHARHSTRPAPPQTLHADATAGALQPCRRSANPRTSASWIRPLLASSPRSLRSDAAR